MKRWRREKMTEGVGCNLPASFDIRIKKVCGIDKWAIY